MSRSQLLHQLQQNDSTAAAIAAKREKVQAALRGGKAIREAREELEESQLALDSLQRELQTSRDEREKVKARIEADKQAMYGGKVKGAREVQNLQLEVESLERRLAQLDDQTLDLMLRRDQAVERKDGAQHALENLEARQDQQQRALSSELKKLDSAAKALRLQRAKLREAVAPADLATYDRLIAQKSGRAVSPVRGDACGVCGMELPIEERHGIRGSRELCYCRGCGRILHA